MKIYKSIADNNIISQFSDQRGNSLFNLFQNTCNIEQAIACSSLFWPEIIELDGLFFIRAFYDDIYINELKQRFNDDKREIERRANAHSIFDLFLTTQSESLLNDAIFDEFTKVLVLFWRLRFKELFPDKTFVVELEYEMYGENGMAITVYQE